ncbi:hypothetical protein [Microbacterium sp.]|jgi:hypothetical protein|uniref:hypothetical protein n=1 Tax=Microbacterium sp. TaxID=51671 RepID=UPI0035AF4C65
MNIETRTRAPRRVRNLTVAVVVGVLTLSAAGCQSTLREEPAPAPTSSAGAVPVDIRPAGLGPHATADQIERVLAYRLALLSERYAGQPADRIAEQLERERDASRGFTAGCLSYRLVEHPAGGWHVVCVQRG